MTTITLDNQCSIYGQCTLKLTLGVTIDDMPRFIVKTINEPLTKSNPRISRWTIEQQYGNKLGLYGAIIFLRVDAKTYKYGFKVATYGTNVNIVITNGNIAPVIRINNIPAAKRDEVFNNTCLLSCFDADWDD
jgi:hypothetical protein